MLHTRLQTSVLRSDYHGQASLLNLLLRNYLHYNLIEQADKLVSKSTFPDSASNNEWARFLYYLGKCCFCIYSKTCVKWPLSKRPQFGYQDQLLLNAGQKYCRMLHWEHSAILLTFIKLPFVIKIFVLSVFERPFYTGFTVHVRQGLFLGGILRDLLISAQNIIEL